MKTRHRAALAISALACLPVVVLVACSSAPVDDAPSRQPIPTANPTGTTPVTDGGDAPDAACFGPDQCFKCEPVQLVDFLNACTDGKCIPFDNAARLPLFKAGEPLPPVP